jgi:protocatechuate 3,4-dioxygenase beta subunit
MATRTTTEKTSETSEETRDAGGLFGNATRRDFARGAFGGVAAVLIGACVDGSSEEEADLAGAEADPGFTPGGDQPITACTVYPQETQGPFYLDINLLRSDITEGKPGTPLTINLLVQSMTGCAPLANAAVDIWHADANGWYSGYPRQGDGHNVDTTGQRFLRGTQVTGSNGRVTFNTIYPGWYRGRTTHIHFKVHIGTRSATSQLYMPEEITSAVYRTGAYVARGQKDTSNARDRIARPLPPLLALTSSGGGYVGALTVSVR